MLATEAVTVRIEPLDRQHAPDIQRMASHPEIVATTRLPDPYPPNGAITFIEQNSGG